MRAHGNEGRLGRRFAIVIGVAAAGVMALGAQTATAEVVKYRTYLSITHDQGGFHGKVMSDRDRKPGYNPVHASRTCMEGRRVTVFKQRPGADRKLATRRSRFEARFEHGIWGYPRLVHGPRDSQARVYAKVRREVHDEFVCRGDRAAYDPTR